MAQELNCPNCGAPLGLSDRCEYCGTTFIDCTMDTEKPFYIKVRHNGALFIDKVMMQSFQKDIMPNSINLYSVNGRYVDFKMPEITYNIELMSLGGDQWLTTEKTF